jgi:hypothetical protein
VQASVRIGIVCAVLGATAGIAAGRALGGPSRRASGPPPAVAASPPPGVDSPLTARLDDGDRAALRAMIREELSAARPGAAPAAPPAAVAAAATPSAPKDVAPPAPESPRQIRAFDAAHAAIDEGLSRGTWTARDRDRLRADLATLPTETRLELEHPLIVAVNERRVQFEGRGPLF